MTELRYQENFTQAGPYIHNCGADFNDKNIRNMQENWPKANKYDPKKGRNIALQFN